MSHFGDAYIGGSRGAYIPKSLTASGRKRPVRHAVRSHVKENGTHIHAYMRGNGFYPQPQLKRDIPKYLAGATVYDDDTKLGVKAWTVNFKYSDRRGDGESVLVISDSYQKALNQSYENRLQKTRKPIEVDIVDPPLSTVIGFLRTGTLTKEQQLENKFALSEAGHGAKEALKGFAHGQMEEGRRKFGELVHGGDIDRLLKLSYDTKNPVAMTRARAELKRKYPEVYSHADFAPQRIVTESHEGKSYADEVRERKEAEDKKEAERKARREKFFPTKANQHTASKTNERRDSGSRRHYEDRSQVATRAEEPSRSH